MPFTIIGFCSFPLMMPAMYLCKSVFPDIANYILSSFYSKNYLYINLRKCARHDTKFRLFKMSPLRGFGILIYLFTIKISALRAFLIFPARLRSFGRAYSFSTFIVIFKKVDCMERCEQLYLGMKPMKVVKQNLI